MTKLYHFVIQKGAVAHIEGIPITFEENAYVLCGTNLLDVLKDPEGVGLYSVDRIDENGNKVESEQSIPIESL